MGILDGKVALITGGGTGVGFAVAKCFLDAGAKVCISGRRAATLREAADQLNAGDRLLTVPADVTEPAQVAELVAKVMARFGPIQILVNNAGMNIKNRATHQLTPEVWRQMVSVNLDGAFYCIHAVLPSMRERKDGVIINVSSISGKRANPLGGASYNAAKFGMSALGICLAAEERENNIRVSNIYPGEIDTPLLDQRPVTVTAEQKKLILRPEDVAAAVFFVATLPPRASIPELVIKPTAHVYV
jgi:NADP-dependent 3-hydroxy acid dehydrogenase YdfG